MPRGFLPFLVGPEDVKHVCQHLWHHVRVLLPHHRYAHGEAHGPGSHIFHCLAFGPRHLQAWQDHMVPGVWLWVQHSLQAPWNSAMRCPTPLVATPPDACAANNRPTTWRVTSHCLHPHWCFCCPPNTGMGGTCSIAGWFHSNSSNP